MAESLDTALTKLFDAEREVRRMHDEIAEASPDAALEAVSRSLEAALKESDEEEASLRLVRIAQLLGEFEGPRAVDMLIDVLASDHPEARDTAGEQLETVAFERFKEVAKGVERALLRLPVGSPALSELPYVFSEIPEPGVVKLLQLFLRHEDADAVAAAIEVAVEMGDPAFSRHLEPLRDDKRVVELADEASEDGSEVTIGELALEAIDLLSELDDDDDDGDDEPPSAQKKR
jgi:HEAT repeat protein